MMPIRKRFSRESFLQEMPQAERVKKIIDEIPSAISLETQRAAIDVMKRTIESVKVNGFIEHEEVKNVIKRMVGEIINSERAMVKLMNIRSFDEYTFIHSINVSILSILTGLELKLGEEDLEELGLGAILHDIGRIMIPSYILKKPGKLSKLEFEVVKKHPLHGYKILTKDRKIGEIPKLIALQHHERFNGKGYPKGLSGDEISSFAGITGLADVYDALTSDRPYRKKFSPYEAMRIIICSCPFNFNPKIGKLFVQKMSIYPAGSLVKLNTGEIGIVVRANKKAIIRPVIRLLLDASGRVVEEGVEVDLMNTPHQFIVGPVDDQILQAI